ncbi:MAG: T9SS type A sorting domain-containing protein [Candidatus Kapaibacterium sp.]
MKKLFLSLLLLALVGNISFSQEKWSQTSKPLGIYNKLPQKFVSWENPNKEQTLYYTPMGVMAVSPNFRVLPNSNEQNEIVLVSQTANPNFMFGSANTSVGSTYGQGCYVTTNGGLNWYGTDLMPNEPGSTSDPAPTIDKNGVIVFTSLNTTGTAFMYGQYSTNFGVNWSTPYTITSSSSDKNFSGTDDYPSSPYYGRSYTVWSNFALSAPPIVFSYTTNSGVSWSSMTQINTPPASHYSQGCDIITGPGLIIYVTWAAPLSASPYTEDFYGFAKSTNGGANWSVTENAFDGNGVRSSSYNGWGVRVNGFPRIGVDRSGGAYNGYIYIVAPQINLAPAGSDGDVVLHRSTDGGTTWSAGIRVNQDAMNNGKVQFFPAIRVDENGGVNVVYYDNRNYPSVGDSCETYMSRSIDGGLTWTDILVSDHRWRPRGEGGSGSYMGDYIGITSGNNKIWPFWFDNKLGNFQAWTASVDIGPAINHTPLGNTEQVSGTKAVNCVIIPAGSPITPSTVKLYYSKDNPVLTSNVTMTNSSGDNWTANLPLSGAGLYRYYITATDGLNRTATYPSGAPAVTVSFIASPDTTKPLIVHTPLTNVPKLSWPATITATVTDNIGVDSVWVGWYINNISTGYRKFKLLNTGGSSYAAAFNSVGADVNINDSIFYRVLARDISSGHNADSTVQNKFKIINEANIIIGTGTTSSNFPFTTYWKDGRTQYLYLASEINAASALIKQIGFDVISVGAPAMTDFKVSFQNTTATTLTGFVNDNWTVAYNPTSYAPAGPGWNMMAMTTPFNYTGGNLLVDICYNNTTYTSYSTVNCTAAPGMYWGRYNDLTEPLGGCGYTAWTLTTGPVGRANTKLVLEPLTGVNPIGSQLPNVYSLSQNYPNPFNPTTKINFALPKQGLVTLKIYDVLGREVRTLVNEIKSAGSYSVDFNASEFSSGVYFYRLQSEGFTDIKKMMLIK